MKSKTNTTIIDAKVKELKEEAKAVGRVAGLPAESCTLYEVIGEAYFENIGEALAAVRDETLERVEKEVMQFIEHEPKEKWAAHPLGCRLCWKNKFISEQRQALKAIKEEGHE